MNGQIPPLPSGYSLDQSQAPPPLPPGYSLDSGATAGQLRNDVGNTVIVPKPGESFADTMQRAAQYGKTVTPDQINAETATAPRKAATVSLAALLGGAAAPAAEVGGAAYGPEIATALAPVAKKYGLRALEGLSAGAGWEIYQALKKHFGEGQ
jgi:hypothetical protein